MFKKCNWIELYWGAKEFIPVNALQCEVKEVNIDMFVNDDHAGDKKSCRLRISFFMLALC